jgi:hypothetical protein
LLKLRFAATGQPSSWRPGRFVGWHAISSEIVSSSSSSFISRSTPLHPSAEWVLFRGPGSVQYGLPLFGAAAWMWQPERLAQLTSINGCLMTITMKPRPSSWLCEIRLSGFRLRNAVYSCLCTSIYLSGSTLRRRKPPHLETKALSCARSQRKIQAARSCGQATPTTPPKTLTLSGRMQAM